MLIAVLFTMAKIWKEFIHQQTNALRRHNTHTHTRILLSHKKEWNFAISNNIDDLEGIMPSEISQPEKDKHYISPIRGI